MQEALFPVHQDEISEEWNMAGTVAPRVTVLTEAPPYLQSEAFDLRQCHTGSHVSRLFCDSDAG